MPKTLDSYLADRVLTRQLYLLRFTAGEQKKVLAILTQTQKELRLKLLGDLTDFSKARVNKLLSESTAIIEAAYKEMVPITKTVEMEIPAGYIVRGAREGGLILGEEGGMWATTSIKNAQSFGEKLEFYKSPGKVLKNADPVSLANYFKSAANKLESVDEISAKDWAKIREYYIAKGYDAINFGPMHTEGADDIWFLKKPTEKAKLVKDFPELKNTRATSGTDLLGLAKAEAAATQTAIASIGLEASLPSAAVLKAMVSDTLIQGAPLADWWEKMGADTAFKFSAQVRQGVVAGETLQQVITRIVGSKKKGIAGIMEISHRHASTLVHDSIMQIANDARMATYKANADIMKGFEWLATLDGNTCIECMAYSGAQWDMEGKPIKGDLPLKNPPLHPNCRCVLTSLTKSYRELGLNIDEMPPGTRASDLGQVPADMSMDSFLRRHDTEYLNDLLGPGRAKLFQDGKITLRQLVSGSGRELTLEELKAL